MKYEIVTHDGTAYEIRQDNPDIIAKLANKLELVAVTLASGKIGYFAKGNVARIQSSHKPIDKSYRVKTGDVNRRASADSEGYKKYKKMREELL